jgi:hypothetical protein
MTRAIFQIALSRRAGSADVAKDDGYEFRLTLFECEVFLANDKEEESGAASSEYRQTWWG